MDRGRVSPILLPLRMIIKETINKLIEQKLAEGDYFVVAMDILAGNKIKLIIDSPMGITIDECVAFSRAIEHNLDREVEDFELEVSSPGLDMPLRVKQQYIKNIGREIDVHTIDGKNLKGELKEVNDNDLLLFEEKKVRVEGHKKKQLVKTEHRILFEEIKNTFVVIKF